jgi:flagellar motor switch protein FliN/FliY
MPDDLFSAGSAVAPGAVEPSPFASIDDEDAAVGKGETRPATRPGESGRLDLVMNIPVRLSVELGRTELPIRDVVNVGRGSVIELDRNVGEPLDVRVNGVLIGHGEIVVIDEERLGLRFVDVVSRAERVSGLT